MENKMQPIHAPAAVAYLLFLQVFLSIIAGTLGGGIGRIIYMLSYLIPIVLFAFLARKIGLLPAVCPTRGGFYKVLPLLPIFLTAVVLTATGTSEIMELLGGEATGGTAEGAGFVSDLFTDCLFPAVLEEGLMRFAVLSLLLIWSDRQAVWVSALLFALLHASVYQIPYAFVGGMFLGLAAVWGASPVYAILFHFLSNLLSLFMQYAVIWFGEETGTYVSLGLCLVIFLLAAWGTLVLLRRTRQEKKPASATDWRALLLSPLSLFAVMMIILTVL